MGPDSPAIEILYRQLLSDLQEIVEISARHAQRGGDVQPARMLSEMTGCEAVVERIMETDRRIAESTDPRAPLPLELADVRNRARQLMSTILGNFARCRELLESYKASSLSHAQSLSNGVRAVSAYRDGRGAGPLHDYQQQG